MRHMKSKNWKWRNDPQKLMFVSWTFSRIDSFVKWRHRLVCEYNKSDVHIRDFTTFFPYKMWAFWSRFSRRCTLMNSCHLQCLISFLDSEKHFWVNRYMKRVFDPQKTSRSTHGSYDHQHENWQLRQKLVTTSQTAFVANTSSLKRNMPLH